MSMFRGAWRGARIVAAGRLLADDFLIPMPAYAARLARLDRRLGVRVVDGADRVLVPHARLHLFIGISFFFQRFGL